MMGLGHREPASRDEQGAVAVMVSVVAVVLFVVAAMVVDLGLARDTNRRAQNSADASALAAANSLYPTSNACTTPAGAQPPCVEDAAAQARSYAAANFGTVDGDWTACADPAPLAHTSTSSACISFDSVTQPSTVRVVLPTRVVKTGLGVLAGVSSISIRAGAGASVSGTPDRHCGLCFLSGVDVGNADFTVSPGGIMVNGDISAGPNSQWQAASIGVVGTTSGGQFAPPATRTAAIPDPFATAAMPSTVGLPVKSNPCGAAGGSGVYGTLTLPNGPCALSPGLYAVVGSWTARNNTDLTGADVTLYALCGSTGAPRACAASGEAGGYLDFKNGSVGFSAPTTGAQAGAAVVYDRNNTRNLSLQGNGGTSITGSVYLRSGALDFNGNSCFGFSQGPVVVNGVVMANGNQSCVSVTNSTDATIPGVPGEVALSE